MVLYMVKIGGLQIAAATKSFQWQHGVPVYFKMAFQSGIAQHCWRDHCGTEMDRGLWQSECK
jgi:hypothetical protein